MYHLHLFYKTTLDERKTLTKVSTRNPLTNIPQTKAHTSERENQETVCKTRKLVKGPDTAKKTSKKTFAKEIVPKFLIVQNVEPEDMHQTNAPANHSETDTHMKLESPGINGEGTKIFHNFLIVITDVFTAQEII